MRICTICQEGFDPPLTGKGRPSTRRTCSDSCRAALTWRTSGSRSAAISAAQKRRGAEITAWNNERWARPGERERLSQRNREAWADPETRAQLSAAIRTAHSTPEMRAARSKHRRMCWADPEYRARVTNAIRNSHRTPHYRALFSALLRERWCDPVWRERWRAGMRRYYREHPEVRAAFSQRMTAWHAARRAVRAPLVVRPPVTAAVVRPPLPEPKRGFSMMGGRAQVRAAPVWRRLDLVP